MDLSAVPQQYQEIYRSALSAHGVLEYGNLLNLFSAFLLHSSGHTHTYLPLAAPPSSLLSIFSLLHLLSYLRQLSHSHIIFIPFSNCSKGFHTWIFLCNRAHPLCFSEHVIYVSSCYVHRCEFISTNYFARRSFFVFMFVHIALCLNLQMFSIMPLTSISIYMSMSMSISVSRFISRWVSFSIPTSLLLCQYLHVYLDKVDILTAPTLPLPVQSLWEADRRWGVQTSCRGTEE